MKVAVIGSTGFVGKNITKELIVRHHQVTGISRNASTSTDANLVNVSADVLDVNKLAALLKGHDAVINAFNPGWQNPNIYNDFIAGSKAIQEAVKLAGIKRFIVIGGAGSLLTAEGKQVVDEPYFPEAFYVGATAARDYLNILKEETAVDWAFFSPALEMHPGIGTGRTGKYRLGKDHPVFDDSKKSVLSGEDLAVVIADELETPRHHKERFTAAY